MLDVLSTLVEAYERKAYPLEQPDPIQVIKFYMKQNGLSAKDLIPMIGQRNSVHEGPNHRRSLIMRMICKLHEAFGFRRRVDKGIAHIAESLKADPESKKYGKFLAKETEHPLYAVAIAGRAASAPKHSFAAGSSGIMIQ